MNSSVKMFLAVIFSVVILSSVSSQADVTVTGGGQTSPDDVNGTYFSAGSYNGKAYLAKNGSNNKIIWFNAGEWGRTKTGWVFWNSAPDPDDFYYYNPVDWGYDPPCCGWEIEDGTAPAPTLSGDVSLAVELVSFSAQVTAQGVQLQWATGSEVDNLGFMVERRVVRANNGSPTDWQKIASYQSHPSLQFGRPPHRDGRPQAP